MPKLSPCPCHLISAAIERWKYSREKHCNPWVQDPAPSFEEPGASHPAAGQFILEEGGIQGPRRSLHTSSGFVTLLPTSMGAARPSAGAEPSTEPAVLVSRLAMGP